MIKKERRFLHQHELEIMNLIWEKGEVTDAQLQADLHNSAGIEGAEVASIIRELVQNGVLNGREEDRTYVYSPLVSRREVEAILLLDIRDGLFLGSNEKMLKALVDNGIASKDELLKVVQSL
jgi:predicted transcriptional regulator